MNGPTTALRFAITSWKSRKGSQRRQRDEGEGIDRGGHDQAEEADRDAIDRASELEGGNRPDGDYGEEVAALGLKAGGPGVLEAATTARVAATVAANRMRIRGPPVIMPLVKSQPKRPDWRIKIQT